MMDRHAPSRPMFSALFLSFVIVELHCTLLADSSQPPQPRHRDRPDADVPLSPSPSPSQFTAPPPHSLKSGGQTEGIHSHHSPRPRPSRAKSHGDQSKSVPPHESNLGKKIGLLFVVIAGALQVAVAGFLGYKVWRIAKTKDHRADCSP